jgi:adenylate cyclase
VSWKRKLAQNWKGGGIGAFLAVGLGLGMLLPNLEIGQVKFKLGENRLKFGESLIHLSYDLPFALRPVKPPQEVVLVYLDDASHVELGQPYSSPWDRGLYAKFLNRLTVEHARGVSFDMVFSNTNYDHLQGDESFARAIKENGKVVLGADYGPNPEGGFAFYRPMYIFYDAAAAWGMVQVVQDQDIEVRRHIHVPPNKDDENNSSMTWELAKVAGSKFAQDPKERFRERWLNYYGPPGSFPSVSFKLALKADEYCPAGIFSNKVVLVGANLKTVGGGERKDEFRTPYTRGMSFAPGVDVQATQVLNLLRGDWLTRTSEPVEIFIIGLAGLFLGVFIACFRPLPAVGIALLGAAAVTFIAHYLFWKERVWFPWMIIVAAQIPIALLWSVVFNSVQLYVQNRLFRQSLEMYLSPKLVKKFESEKDILKPGANKQMLTILFSDIASFTSISQGMDSNELAREMNKYFQSAVSNCIHATDGTIVKYIGDAIFAFWNAPDNQIDHAMRACEAALRFRDQPPQHMNGQLLVTRIGLHTGVANVGNFGSTSRVDYTALGENINLASRMEGLNKYLGTEVLITSETQEGVTGRLATRFLGKFQLKGFDTSVGVHELQGQLERAEALRPVNEAFSEALKLFQQRDFPAAETAFRGILEIKPADGPSKFYLKFIAEIREHPLPDDWQGEVELKEK